VDGTTQRLRPYVGKRRTSVDLLAAMEAFVLVVDTEPFSATAHRLNVGQRALSKLALLSKGAGGSAFRLTILSAQGNGNEHILPR
jgi:hypothetical protein